MKKIKWQKKKLTFMIIPEANRSVFRIRIPNTIAYFIPIMALTIISTLLVLYILHMHTLYSNNKLKIQLSEKENQFEQTVASKNQTIEGLQNDVITLSNQANEIKDKVEELKELENEIKGISAPIASKEYPVNIASFGYNTEINNFRQTAAGGTLINVHNDDISKLASDTESGFILLDGEMNQLLDGLSEAKVQILEYQKLMKITPSIWPSVSNRVTSAFGYRKDPFTNSPSFHTGIDIGGNRNDPVYATADGKVSLAGYDNSHGNNIIINHSNGISTRYMHLNKSLVKQGEIVIKGQKIGLLGSTGRSTGPHLHYEVISNGTNIDPKPYMKTTRKDGN